MQTAVFHIHDIVTENQFKLVKTIGELGALLWDAEINDLKQYLEDLNILIDNVLDAFALIDPAKILVKIKLHLLKHIPEHIHRFGPAVQFSTEVFECFNAVFRMSSVLSNHQAPSRDIAVKNCDMGWIKHLLTGGLWQQNGQMKSAGIDAVAVLKNNPIIQRHPGWVPPHGSKPGSVCCPGQEKCTMIEGNKTQASTAICESGLEHVDILASKWIVGTHVTAQSGDSCPVGSWVIVHFKIQSSENTTQTFIGQIDEILCDNQRSHNIVTVTEFTLAEGLHHYYGMPVLHQPQKQYVITPESLQFIINVQHDCRAAGCAPTDTRKQRQERLDSDREISIIKHNYDDIHYIINTHALHNAAKLCQFLP
ncbi:hypothetical protein VKT23_011472 [Stygiomarasmius scandens]|uniref:Uncharacterized protein n=1 Tax=Marasmiellus scandens TaxID=2682957 RepID=A0ABR1JAX4_9AGAR